MTEQDYEPEHILVGDIRQLTVVSQCGWPTQCVNRKNACVHPSSIGTVSVCQLYKLSGFYPPLEKGYLHVRPPESKLCMHPHNAADHGIGHSPLPKRPRSHSK
mmetsp:Transcript_11564/g.25927  ORF Transcript_11564/g.25927 Transcript_11564/m.25927 type:complete len:103 (-) Transcript_11564:692-1000(-)